MTAKDPILHSITPKDDDNLHVDLLVYPDGCILEIVDSTDPDEDEEVIIGVAAGLQGIDELIAILQTHRARVAALPPAHHGEPSVPEDDEEDEDEEDPEGEEETEEEPN